MSDLNGMVVMINGGTQGLGEETARQCVAAGAAGLVLIGRSADRGTSLSAALTDAGTPTIYVAADIGDAASAPRVLAAARERFGVVHGLVNVAALTARGNVFNTTVELWDEMMAVNVRGPFQLLQGVATMLRDAGAKGSIVNVGSVEGHGGQPSLHPYAVSKGALVTMTKNAAFSLMRHGIRVNQVNPGWMDTESEDAVQRKWEGAGDDWLEKAEASQPMGRLVKPDEVARMIVYLLSPASGLITGVSMDIDQSVTGAGAAPKPTWKETPR